MRNTEIGSAKYGTAVVKTDEYLLLAETMIENGATVSQARQDIEFLDDCISMSRMVNVIGRAKSITVTKAGNLRKGRKLSDFISSRLDQMVSDQ